AGGGGLADADPGGLDGRVPPPGAATSGGPVATPVHRTGAHAHDHLAVDLQGDLGGPAHASGHEQHGPVDAVEDPAAARRAEGTDLLAQHPVVRALAGEDLADGPLDG